jgi:hypothetical protein
MIASDILKSVASLSESYPQYQSILTALTLSKYGKGYIHCMKYRIITAVEVDVGEIHHDTVVEWANEWGNTWRNTASRCARGAEALATLGERTSRGTLTPEQEKIRQTFQILFSGPIRLLPYIPFILTNAEDLPAQEWQRLKVEKNAVNLKSKEIDDFVRMVERWFP